MVRQYSRRRSDVCPWNTTQPEVFRYGFGIFAFDVRRAKQLICASPREVETVATPPELIEKLIGRPPDPDPEGIHYMSLGTIAVDWKEAEKADTNIPLIVAQARVDPDSDDRLNIIIDGHHRLAKAYLDGIPELPYVLLTEKESDQVMETTIRLKRRR